MGRVVGSGACGGFAATRRGIAATLWSAVCWGRRCLRGYEPSTACRRPEVLSPMRLFLSYASQDVEPAIAIYLALRDQGHTVFFDRTTLRGGDEYHNRIRTAIERAHVFVFLITPDALDAGQLYPHGTPHCCAIPSASVAGDAARHRDRAVAGPSPGRDDPPLRRQSHRVVSLQRSLAWPERCGVRR